MMQTRQPLIACQCSQAGPCCPVDCSASFEASYSSQPFTFRLGPERFGRMADQEEIDESRYLERLTAMASEAFLTAVDADVG